MHTDGYWLFKNLFTQNKSKKNWVDDDLEIGAEFIKIIKQAPDYYVRDFENIVNSSWDKKINPVIGKVILDIIIEKVNKIENKIKHNKISDNDYDFINDVLTLIPNPYSHSPLLGNDTYRISQLRESVHRIMKKIEDTDNLIPDNKF